MKIKAIRHGEILFVPVKSLPRGLKKAITNVIMRGSGDNPHIAKNVDLYFKKEGDYVFGYLRAKRGAKLYHKEHGIKKVNGLMEAPLKAGYYQLRQQVEKTNEGLRPVQD
jgi:hypothetical protein